ncbi:uncharacterized protein LOC134227472 [Armigeres subalbatus]|uniref:uncharacterized protein LOC134227472 n=1 Tax=Armigeres subalbatus TaxID=124917 RepID=UPI002ED43A71
MTAAPPPLLGSVHFTDSEALARQTFSPFRYNVPLFVYKKLMKPGVRRRDGLGVLASGRRQLHQRMLIKNYDRMSNCKDHVNINLELNPHRTWEQEQQTAPFRENPFKRGCPKSLRNGHKEWSLAPNRYRLANNISDYANKSTGTKGLYQCFTGERFAPFPGEALQKKNRKGSEVGFHDRALESKLPAEMDRLGHPMRYFVGKIRPGDKNTQRASSRLALAQPTFCWRNPHEPGPNHYFKGIFDIPPKKAPPIVIGRCQQRIRVKQLIAGPSVPGAASVHHSYCVEPFLRPPPGRYQLPVSIPMPKPVLPDIQPRPSATHQYDFSYNFAWNPYRQPATLLMHTVNIPVRRQRRGRNMKVAFGSATARFKDREFYPIGALKYVFRKDARPTKKESTGEGVVNQKNMLQNVVTVGETKSSANLCRTPTKLFVIPRKHQTKRILSVPDLGTVIPGETDQRTRQSSLAERKLSSTTMVTVPDLESDNFGEGGSSVMEIPEIIVTRASFSF